MLIEIRRLSCDRCQNEETDPVGFEEAIPCAGWTQDECGNHFCPQCTGEREDTNYGRRCVPCEYPANDTRAKKHREEVPLSREKNSDNQALSFHDEMRAKHVHSPRHPRACDLFPVIPTSNSVITYQVQKDP